MNFHPFIKIIQDENEKNDDQDRSDQDEQVGDETIEKMNQFLIILISYWEFFVQNINGSDFTPFKFNGQQLIFTKKQNADFDSYEDKQLLEKEMVLWVNQCFKYHKCVSIKSIKREDLNLDKFSQLSVQNNLCNELNEGQYFQQKSFVEALNYYQQWKNEQFQLQQNFNYQEIQAYQYYIYQFQVQKQFLNISLEILNNKKFTSQEKDYEQSLINMIENILNQNSELQEPILVNYKIYWSQKEFQIYKQELLQQKTYYVTEEQKQQLNDKLAELRCLQLIADMSLHDFTVLYYKYNFIIKSLIDFERFIYFNDYDIHFERIFQQLNISKLDINWVTQILNSDEIILF